MRIVKAAWIELTNECQLECSHCYSNSGPGRRIDDRLKHSDYVSLISELAELFQCREFRFIGGEPLAYACADELLRCAASHGAQYIRVFSNLYSLPPRTISALTETKASIATSIYGDCASVHDSVTGRPGSFARLIANLSNAIQLGIPVRAAFIETPRNRGLYGPTSRMLERLGVELTFDAERPFGRAASAQGALTDLCGCCGKDILCVGYEGLVAPCIMSKEWAIGNLLSQNLSDILDSGRLRQFRKDLMIAQSVRESSELSAGHSTCCPLESLAFAHTAQNERQRDGLLPLRRWKSLAEV